VTGGLLRRPLLYTSFITVDEKVFCRTLADAPRNVPLKSWGILLIDTSM
jgi:hypothetical protein